MEKTVYEVTITAKRHEMTLKGTQWEMGGGGEPSEYGYTPQVKEIKVVSREVFSYSSTEADVPEIIKAVLENSKPLSDFEEVES